MLQRIVTNNPILATYLVRLYCSIEDLGDDLLEYFLSTFEELGTWSPAKSCH